MRLARRYATALSEFHERNTARDGVVELVCGRLRKGIADGFRVDVEKARRERAQAAEVQAVQPFRSAELAVLPARRPQRAPVRNTMNTSAKDCTSLRYESQARRGLPVRRRHPGQRAVAEPDIEHRIHHAGHGYRRT